MLKISELSIKNFRSIRRSTICLSKESIIVGKNNIGKSSIIDAIANIDNLKLSDFNIELLSKIWNCRKRPQDITS